jgi:hypothetical protein
MINGDELVGFLGHSSSSNELDNYLDTFSMSLFFEQDYGIPASPGKFILFSIGFNDLDKNSRNAKFSGKMPYGLNLGMSKADVDNILGQSIKQFTAPAGFLVAVYKIGDKQIRVRFSVADELEWVIVEFQKKQ